MKQVGDVVYYESCDTAAMAAAALVPVAAVTVCLLCFARPADPRLPLHGSSVGHLNMFDSVTKHCIHPHC